MANEADLTFLQKMIPHHQHGIERARVAARAGSTEVQEMATHVVEDQGQEVAEMEQLLADVGGAPGDAVPEPVKQRAMSQLVADLEAKPAMMFDRSFVATTIVHHMGAIDLAEMQLAAGEDDRVLALARSTQQKQLQELEQLTAMLEAIRDGGTIGEMKRAVG